MRDIFEITRKHNFVAQNNILLVVLLLLLLLLLLYITAYHFLASIKSLANTSRTNKKW